MTTEILIAVLMVGIAIGIYVYAFSDSSKKLPHRTPAEQALIVSEEEVASLEPIFSKFSSLTYNEIAEAHQLDNRSDSQYRFQTITRLQSALGKAYEIDLRVTRWVSDHRGKKNRPIFVGPSRLIVLPKRGFSVNQPFFRIFPTMMSAVPGLTQEALDKGFKKLKLVVIVIICLVALGIFLYQGRGKFNSFEFPYGDLLSSLLGASFFIFSFTTILNHFTKSIEFSNQPSKQVMTLFPSLKEGSSEYDSLRGIQVESNLPLEVQKDMVNDYLALRRELNPNMPTLENYKPEMKISLPHIELHSSVIFIAFAIDDSSVESDRLRFLNVTQRWAEERFRRHLISAP